MSRNVARGSILSVGAQAWHVVMAFLLYAFLARSLGPEEFGRWRLVLSVLNWLELWLNAGMIRVVTKSIAARPAERHRSTRAGYIGQGALALALFAGALIVAGPVAGALKDPSLAYLIRLSVLDVPVYAAFMLAGSVILGNQRFERHALAMSLYATTKFITVGGLVLFGFSVPGALIGNALSSIVGFVAMFTPVPRERGAWRAASHDVPDIAKRSVPFLSQNLVEGLIASMDLWMVQRLVGVAAVVGLYGSASTLAEVPAFLFLGLNRALFSSIARVEAEGDRSMSARYAQQGVRLATLVTVLGIGVIVATGREALTFIYSAAYAEAFLPLAILMAAAAGRTVLSVCVEILMVRDRERRVLAILVAAVAAEIVLLAVLTRWYGSPGAAAAVAVVATGAAAIGVCSLRDVLGVRMLLTVVRAVIASAIVGVALHFIAPASWMLLVAYPLAGIAYIGFLLLFGEVDRDDIASIRKAAGR